MVRRGRALLVLLAVLGVVVATLPAVPADAAPTGSGDTRAFRGVNWADPRDNYASDAVVPSGLDRHDTYLATYLKAVPVVAQFRGKLKANTIRFPVNPATTSSSWWHSYRGAIDAALDQGDKVILSYWEADDAKDGRVDDAASYQAMWDTVVRSYAGRSRVYFEPMNEPFGYTLDEWVGLTSRWVDRYEHRVPRSRMIISGTGYNDDVTGVGAAKQLDGTLLSLHFYGFWDDATTEAEWKANLEPRIGSYGWRTIIDEAGSPMTTGLNYGNHEGNVSTAYLGALTEVARNNRMGIVYWPGLRTDDSYSMMNRSGRYRLVVNSASGLAQLQWGWGLLRTEPTNDEPAAPPGQPLRQISSDRCVDIPGESTTPGTELALWDCTGGSNQSWNATAPTGEAGRVTVYRTSCLTAASLTDGAATMIEKCGGSAVEQSWVLGEDRTLRPAGATDLCLGTKDEGTDGGTPVQVQVCTGATSQQWERG